jgi:hypothetical protein
MPINLDRYNERVRDWGRNILSQISARAAANSISHRSNSPSSGSSIAKIRDRYRMRAGAIDQVGIKFPRTLIYTHKGAGKGRGGNTGSRWVDKYGATKSTNPASKGKMGSGGRKEKPFFNQALESAAGVEDLATIVAEETGDAIMNKMFIK